LERTNSSRSIRTSTVDQIFCTDSDWRETG